MVAYEGQMKSSGWENEHLDPLDHFAPHLFCFESFVILLKGLISALM